MNHEPIMKRFGEGFSQKIAIALAGILIGAVPPWIMSWIAFFRDTPNRTQVETMIDRAANGVNKDITIIKEALLEGKADRRETLKQLGDIGSRVTRIEAKVDARP